MTEQITWTCPDCAEVNHDELDPIYGPFTTCTCSNCGMAFDQDTLHSEGRLDRIEA